MVNPANDNANFITVVCPTCAARIYQPLQAAAYQTKCPDCFVSVRVPARDEYAAARPAPPKPPAVGTYDLTTDQPIPKPKRHTVTLLCPICSARLNPEVHRMPRQVACPDCSTPVTVPALSTVQEAQRRKELLQPVPVAVDPYAMGTELKRRRRETPFLTAVEDIWQADIPDLPRWTFFSGVFDFPFRAPALYRWTLITAGCVLVALMLTIGYFIYLSSSGYSGVAVVFLALPVIWFSIWTAGLISSCFIAILVDTAAGNQKVVNWPDSNWRDWVLDAVYVGFVAVTAMVVSNAVGRLVEYVWPDGVWWTSLGMLLLTFPVFMLSTQEGNSLFKMVTPPILRTLVTCWWGWAMFFLLTSALFAMLLGVLWIGTATIPLFTPLLAAPFVATVALIYPRLLGRLAWRAGLLHDDE